jgi:foldase protein PrsA
MFKPVRCIAALGAVFLTIGGLAACGSGGIPSDAVVQVNGQPITKAAFEHWLGVAAAASSGSLAGQKAAKPVLPEPPSYTACVAHLKEVEPKPAKGQKAKTEAELKAQCEQQYSELKQQALGFLITVDWIFDEAQAQGLHVSDSEVAKKFNQLKDQQPQLRKEAEFKKFLASTGYTVSDLLLRVKYSMLEAKLREKITNDAKQPLSEATVAKYYNEHKSQYKVRHTQQTLAQVRESIKQQLASSQQQTALTSFVKEFRKRWEGRTECRAGYMVQNCKGYKAPKSTAGGVASTAE